MPPPPTDEDFTAVPDDGATPAPPSLAHSGDVKPPRKAAATFIFLTVTLDMLALGMIAPVLPSLVAGFLHGNAVSTSQMMGIFSTLFAFMQFFCSPILGSLSDRFGRRPIVLLSNFGMGFDYLLMAWAPLLPWLFLGRIISGLTASSIPTAMAYMADVTPHEKRAGAFGMLNAAFGMGFVLGPALGGLLGHYNPRLPFLVASGLSLLNGMYGLFVLPESLSKANRNPFSWKRANPIGSLALLRRHKGMLGLACILLLGYLAQNSLMNVWVLYTKFQFNWTTDKIGYSLAVVGIFTGIYGALVVKRVVAKVGERKAILIGLTCGAIGYSFYGISKDGTLFWLGIPVMGLMGLAWPSIQSMMSRNIGPHEQGHMQGAINGLRGIAGLIGPGVFTYIFSKSIGDHALIHLPGTPFFLASALLVTGLVVASYVTTAAHQRAATT